MKKKSFGFGKNVSVSEKKSFGSDTDTEIGPWFRFPIPKPSFAHTLISAMHTMHIQAGTELYLRKM